MFISKRVKLTNVIHNIVNIRVSINNVHDILYFILLKKLFIVSIF